MTNHKKNIPPQLWAQPIDGFLQYLGGLGYSAATITTRSNHLTKFANSLPKDICPRDVSTSDLFRFIAISPSKAYKKSVKNSLNSFFKWAVLTGLCANNPATALPAFRPERPRPKPCPDKYIIQALEHATYEERIMLLLASELGLRRAEIARVHSDDVAGTIGTYMLLVHGKGEKQRILPCPDTLAEDILFANGFVFPGRFGGHVEESYIGKKISALLPQGYSAHKLRHRFATKAYELNHDILAVKEALGHTNVETTEHYVAASQAALFDVIKYTQFQSEATTTNEHIPAIPERLNYGKMTLGNASPDVVHCAWLLLLFGGHQAYMQGNMSFSLRISEVAESAHLRVSAAQGTRAATIVKRAGRYLELLGFAEICTVEAGYIKSNFIQSFDTMRPWFMDYVEHWTAQ